METKRTHDHKRQISTSNKELFTNFVMFNDEKAKPGEIIFSVTQNLTNSCVILVTTHVIEKLHHSLTVRNFVECTINKKSHDLLAQFVINRYS